MASFNTICHVEIPVLEMDRATRFYGTLFGWNIRSFMPEMSVFGAGDEHIGGFMKVDSVPRDTFPQLWFRVKDLDAMLSKAVELGARIFAPRSEVPSVGWSGVFEDLDGNRVGLVMFTEDAE